MIAGKQENRVTYIKSVIRPFIGNFETIAGEIKALLPSRVMINPVEQNGSPLLSTNVLLTYPV